MDVSVFGVVLFFSKSFVSLVRCQWWEDTPCSWGDPTGHGWDRSPCTSRGSSRSTGHSTLVPGTTQDTHRHKFLLPSQQCITSSEWEAFTAVRVCFMKFGIIHINAVRPIFRFNVICCYYCICCLAGLAFLSWILRLKCLSVKPSLANNTQFQWPIAPHCSSTLFRPEYNYAAQPRLQTCSQYCSKKIPMSQRTFHP